METAETQALAFLSFIFLVTVDVESILLKILATHCLVEGGQASLLNSHKTQMPTHLCVHSTSLLQSTMKIFKLLFLKPLKDSFYCSVTHFTVDKKRDFWGDKVGWFYWSPPEGMKSWSKLRLNFFLTFPACFQIPIFFSNSNHINEYPLWFKHVTNQEDKPSEIAKLPKNVKSDLLAHFGSLFS